MHNSPWWYLNLDLVPFLIFHYSAVIMFFGSEFEDAIVVHGHGFVTGHIVTSPVNFPLVLYYHELSKHPWQYVPHLTGFLDIKFAIRGVSEAAQDDRRLELC